MTGKLTVDQNGKIRGPATITYNDPWPCPNGNPGQMSVPHGIQGLVIHTMVGNLPGTISVFNQPSFQASAHFGVDQDGRIHQFGSVRGWKAWAQEAGNPNWYSVECADNGNPDNPLTAAQITAVAQLLECLSAPGVGNFPIQVTNSTAGEGLGVHFMGGLAWGGHTCPDEPPGHVRSGQRQEIVTAALALRGGQPAPPAKTATVPQPRQWTTAGQLPLAGLAAQHGTTPAAILRLTAEKSPGQVYPAAVAAWLNDLFAGRAAPANPVPKGLVLWLPS
jgi:N-acetylmuramoyl-L-alanine amidase